jgi:hypothetical protein
MPVVTRPSTYSGAEVIEKLSCQRSAWMAQTIVPLERSSATSRPSSGPKKTLSSPMATPLLFQPQQTEVMDVAGMLSAIFSRRPERLRVRGKDRVHLMCHSGHRADRRTLSARASGHRAHRAGSRCLPEGVHRVHSSVYRSVPDRPDLHQLKRQAKELLAAFRAGSADAVGEVASHYRGADADTFALHDAQLVPARAHGFDSWSKLKAFVDGATVSRLIEAVRAGDAGRVEAMLQARPEIVNMDASPNDEHRALHHAVLARDAAMVGLLMARGADAHIGIYPHRVPTTAMAIAAERGYEEIAAIIREAEAARPRESSVRRGIHASPGRRSSWTRSTAATSGR